MDQRKLRHFLGFFEALPASDKARLLRSFCFDALTSLDKRAAQSSQSADEWWLSSLKHVFLAPFDECNLMCLGCWVRRKQPREPSFDDQDYIVGQIKRLGTFYVHLSGSGEPFMNDSYRDVLFRLARKHRDTRFTVLTNGTLITEDDARRIRQAGNLVPLVSIDGLGPVNDRRRGVGVYARLLETFRLMREHHIIFCFSTMVHKGNYLHVTSRKFAKTMAAEGSRAGLFCRYVRIGEDIDRELDLTPEERELYGQRLDQLNRVADIPLRDLEFLEQHRGCMARRGVSIFIDPISGVVSPCFKTPFAPPSCNLLQDRHPNRLREILSSGFFRRYRDERVSGDQCFTTLDSELAWFQEAPELPANVKDEVAEARRRGCERVETVESRAERPSGRSCFP
jgi:MoaA/NifB/PqqE/SkfB family radical SAM enzyme